MKFNKLNKFSKKKLIIISLIVIAVLLAIAVTLSLGNESKEEYISYKEFNTKLENNEISVVLIEDDIIKFNLKESNKEDNKKEYENDDFLYYTENPNVENFKEKVLLKDVKVYESSATESMILVFDILFYGVFFGAVGLVCVKLVGMNNETFKVVKHTKVKFDDIAGMDNLKNEMMKIVEILKNPEAYKNQGIRQI